MVSSPESQKQEIRIGAEAQIVFGIKEGVFKDERVNHIHDEKNIGSQQYGKSEEGHRGSDGDIHAGQRLSVPGNDFCGQGFHRLGSPCPDFHAS